MDTESRTVTNQTVEDSRNQVEAPIKEIYRKLIMEVLSAHADTPEDNQPIPIVTVFDTHNDRYQLLRTGWNGSEHIFNPLLHLDIIEDKVWIQQNKTDIEIGEELAKVGIPKSNIVLGLVPPHLRSSQPRILYSLINTLTQNQSVGASLKRRVTTTSSKLVISAFLSPTAIPRN
ncbi:hypothetical protein DSM106972_011160 [Dulcicalothrix desertica PCC 7102]|uniref:XisI protein n=1 Tax=Dulcicalothrix desertica PCC 7102 TaxID=232991 RepID=A0A433VSG1_9CYAN|nr:XisI protein [Dulcicalothrix desertica]RUT09063.1 hypothetical protein DSM106972_011160 [Dulcicalothrix desertica PCC 7102]TWH49937.1 XisI protein [Dulcicalothrix desertica PCC 7102]